jgi:hypothetical protein
MRCLNKSSNTDRVVADGHLYELDNFENPIDVPKQTLQFIEKKPAGDGFPNSSMITVAEGTTNEEVLSVLIHRIQTLNFKFPCRENSIVVTKLQEALMWLNFRTQNRISRGVEGKAVA